MESDGYYVYILTRERNSVFYVGVTNNLIRRVYEHKMELVEGFTKKYNIKILVIMNILRIFIMQLNEKK